ncbi:MAG: TolC family protein [Desulfobacteraceae bacterium]
MAEWKEIALAGTLVFMLFAADCTAADRMESEGFSPRRSASRPEEAGPLQLTAEDAVLMALENNRSLVVERFTPEIKRTFEEQERAVFDPVLEAGAAFSRDKSETTAGSRGLSTRTQTGMDLGISKRLPTGAEVGVELEATRNEIDDHSGRYAARVGLNFTQALLRGRGRGVNLASLRQARLDTQASEYELRGFDESLAARTEQAFWDYVLARRSLLIYQESLRLAERQLLETREMVAVGRLAETELVAARAEVALRRQELIDAENMYALARLILLRLLSPRGPGLWDREVLAMDRPSVPEADLGEVEEHVELAMQMRPDLNQARLLEERDELEVVKTRNGILPRLDLFVSLGRTGYAESFGSAADDIPDDGYDLAAGLNLRFDLGERDSRARLERAELSREQAREALDNLAELVEMDVRKAYIVLQGARQQITASRATLDLEQEKVRIETEKFRVGRSTSFMVAQAQRDLVRARIQEINAVVEYLNALVELHRQDGSLLERLGVDAPGRGIPAGVGSNQGAVRGDKGP